MLNATKRENLRQEVALTRTGSHVHTIDAGGRFTRCGWPVYVKLPLGSVQRAVERCTACPANSWK